MSLVQFNNTLPSFLDEFFGGDIFDSVNSSNRIGSSLPAVNIRENDDEFNVQVAAPGMKKEDFDVELNNNILTISSEKKGEKEEKSKDGNFTRREFNYTSFKRTFTLPDSVDSEKIHANYEDGVLKLSIPKREEAKIKAKRKIEIE